MRIEYSRQADKDLGYINKPMESRLKEAIEKLPAGDVKPIKGHQAYYRLRVGGYRVIFAMDTDLIVIVSIGPRGQVYKGL